MNQRHTTKNRIPLFVSVIAVTLALPSCSDEFSGGKGKVFHSNESGNNPGTDGDLNGQQNTNPFEVGETNQNYNSKNSANNNSDQGDRVEDFITGSGHLQTVCDPKATNGLINFESVSNASYGLAINDQYESTHGIRFNISNNDSPSLVKTNELSPSGRHAWVCGSVCNEGPVGENFANTRLNAIAPADKSRVGNYVLAGLAQNQKLEILYSYPVREASGELIDVDNGESWDVVAYDREGNVVTQTSVVSPSGDLTSDGRAKSWQLSSSQDIYKIELSVTLTSGVGGGLALDNFSPGKICNLPSTF